MLLPNMYERPAPVREALSDLLESGTDVERGAVFTKPEVARGILKLCRYTADRDLGSLRLLEPSCGEGDFLIPAISLLLESDSNIHGSPKGISNRIADSIRGIELHQPSHDACRERVRKILENANVEESEIALLLKSWLVNDDFLLADLGGAFDVVVGNPPYVRQERIPDALLSEYKLRYSCLYDRADLYVLFYERGLDLLKSGGALGFICANRWIKNKYGGPLREKVTRNFWLEAYIDLEQADAFHEKVDAYPSITVIRRAKAKATKAIAPGEGRGVELDDLFRAISASHSDLVTQAPAPGIGRDPWLVDSPKVLRVLRTLEDTLPTLEESGARVGIGVATGADRVFIRPGNELDIEPNRKLPLAMASDLRLEGVAWSGKSLANPWGEDGRLVDLADYPKLGAYFHENKDRIAGRHTAMKNPTKWYRTIDKVDTDLTTKPKLLIPDIKGTATVVFDEGKYYPHHNLYVVTSDEWDLRGLQAVLRSSVALMFVAAYCVKMAGGFLRFQAQYLRRIRVPHWGSLSSGTQESLIRVAQSASQDEIDQAVFQAYGLDGKRAQVIIEFASAARVK